MDTWGWCDVNVHKAGLWGLPPVGLLVLAHQHEHRAILCGIVYEEGEALANLQQQPQHSAPGIYLT